MHSNCQQYDTRGRSRSISARSLPWFVTLLGTLLVAVPSMRTVETGEVGPAKEQVEDVSPVVRTASLRRTALHGRREVLVVSSSIQARLGREERSEPVRLDGHRLPNGLLAPMTC